MVEMFTGSRWRFALLLKDRGVVDVMAEMPAHARVKPRPRRNSEDALGIAWTLLECGLIPLFERLQLPELALEVERSQMVSTRNTRGAIMLLHRLYNDLCGIATSSVETQVSETPTGPFAVPLEAIDDLTYALMLANDGIGQSCDVADKDHYSNFSVERSCDFVSKIHRLDPRAATMAVEKVLNSFEPRQAAVIRAV